MKTTYTQLTLSLILGLMLPFSTLMAQINPYIASYYTNPYLANPALAGLQNGTNINLAYRSQWNDIPGAPILQSATIDYGFDKTGLGLTINYDKAGLQKQTQILASYAYHLPLNSISELHFGLSIGFRNQRLDNTEIIGNSNDQQIGVYNERKTFIDGDFGIAFSSKKFKIELAFPNLKDRFKKDVINSVDVQTFYSAMSYEIDLDIEKNTASIEPKLAYRGVKGFKDIIDAGAMLSALDKKIMLMAIYHSDKSASFGIGLDYLKKYLFLFSYSTQNTELSSYTAGNFEINLRLKL